MKLMKLILLITVFTFSHQVVAQDTQKLCAKIKECALSQTGGEELSAQMKEAFAQMIDAQCAAIASQYNAKFRGVNLQAEADACVESIVNQSCQTIASTQGTPATSACREFERAANDAGINVTE